MGAGRSSVLLLGNYRPTLSIARNLAAHGYRIIVSSHGGEGCCEFSRHIAELWDHTPVEECPESFRKELLAFLASRDDIDILLPITESYVHFVADHHRDLASLATIASPDPQTVKLFADKVQTLHLAQSHNLSVLPFSVARHDSDFDAIANDVSFPMVIRPLTRPRFDEKKALIIDDLSAYTAFVAKWAKPGERFLIQKRGFGARHNLYFASFEGRLTRTLETRILRTDHQDGTGLAVDGVTCQANPQISSSVGALTEAAGYTGIGLAQFIVDAETGQHWLLEVNPRVAGSQAIADAMGFETGPLAIAAARGVQPDEGTGIAINRPGRRYAWSYGDLRGLRAAWANGELNKRQAMNWGANMAWTALRADHHMTWRLTDPVPTLALFAKQVLPAWFEDRNRRAALNGAT